MFLLLEGSGHNAEKSKSSCESILKAPWGILVLIFGVLCRSEDVRLESAFTLDVLALWSFPLPT